MNKGEGSTIARKNESIEREIVHTIARHEGNLTSGGERRRTKLWRTARACGGVNDESGLPIPTHLTSPCERTEPSGGTKHPDLCVIS
jgi:hypothetical protein